MNIFLRYFLLSFTVLLLLAACGDDSTDSSDSSSAGLESPEQEPEPAPEPEPQPSPEPLPVEPLPLPDPAPMPLPDIDVAEVARVLLVAPANNESSDVLQNLENGSIIDLDKLPSTTVNIVAEPGAGQLGSMGFSLPELNINRIENNPPYSLANELTNIAVGNGGLVAGSYSLTITPYSLPDGEGEVGQQAVVAFQVVSTAIPSEPDPSDQVPKISSLTLVEKAANSPALLPRGQIVDGQQINMSMFTNSFINIIANSADEDETGSVRFVLEGPTALARNENNAPYTLATEPENWDVSAGEPLAGDYTLTVIPYEQTDANGQFGEQYRIRFSIVYPEGEPEPVPDVLTLVDDAFSVTQNTVLTGRNVSSNDEVLISDAVFTVAQTTVNGLLDLSADGRFTYAPNTDFVGSDSFIYQIEQNGVIETATVRITILSNTPAVGFTPILASEDSKIIYVSHSSGADSNDCLSEASPCKTIQAALDKGREGFPDHILLKRGDTWRAPSDKFYWLDRRLFSGRSPIEPAVLGYYGEEGDRPRIEKAGGAFYRGDKYILRNFHFIGIEFAAYRLEVGHPEFTGIYKDGSGLDFVGGSENILIEDCVFSHSEIGVQPYDSDGDGQEDNSINLTIRRNIFTGNYGNETSFTRSQRPSNMFLAGIDGLLVEENVIDMGGWNPNVAGAGATQLNHGIYMQYGQNGNEIIARNNIFTRNSSHGLQARSGGLVEDNFFARNSIGMILGYAQTTLPSGTDGIARGNVISEGWTMLRVPNSCQNFTCTGALWGLEYNNASGNGQNFVLENNIVSGLYDNGVWPSLRPEGLFTAAYFSQTRATPRVFTGNIEYNWTFNQNPENPENYVDPGRTLGDYNENLGGANSFDEFMNVVLSRPLQSWDERYTAIEINRYIRAGYEVQ